MKLRPVLLAFAFAAGLPGQMSGADAGEAIKEGFEGKNLQKDINSRFQLCHRPENTFRLSRGKSRSGKQSLEISITPPPVGVSARQKRGLNPKNCILESEKDSYRNDELERAEIWEDKKQNPKFGEGSSLFYGFSMWVDAKSAPPGDFNRLVLGQWKAGCITECSLSPFLAQRLTGGFYHITLDVDATAETDGGPVATTCKVVLAFTAERPPLLDAPLALDRTPQCESRLQYPPLPENQLEMAEKIEIKRERYLPNPFGRWTDLVFRVDGGKTDGVIQVWANGQLIATAKGWIGHRISAGQKQYFKFGPYRDPAGYGMTVYLDNLARGRSYDAVDPSKF